MNQFYGNVLPMQPIQLMQPMQPINCYSKSQVELWNKNRLLWQQHVYWTRMAVTALVFKLPDVKFVLARLLRNATDMGDSLRPYYGDEIANAYGGLIREHLTIAADLVTAAANGETEKVETLEANWYRNADEIAEFLNRINPYIDREAFRKMMYSHLALLKLEVVCMIQRNFELEVQVFDRIEAEALMMADMISEGIFKQFPYAFVPQ
ncbi:acetylglutamate kinase [Sporosarcina sp. 179-K 8C2 HS]|uniref:acetylglutamate kinase n=1 Tax=Sporosarcina sp. 179-K 8C2 HS TaxID=3142387 RepID=UPI0039A3C6A6